MRFSLNIVGCASLLGALLLSPVAHAEQSDPAAAEALFREGREAADRGDFKTACAKFKESNRLDPAVGTVFNLADCHERLGQLARAWTLFQEVVQRVPAGDDRKKIALQRIAQLEPRLPRLVIRLDKAAPSGTRVQRDDVVLGDASLDTALPVDPGEHVITVEAPGTQPAEFRVTLAEGEKKQIDVAPGRATLAPPKGEPAATPRRKSSDRTLGYVLGGIGVAGLVTGTIAGVLVLNKKSTVDENCDAQKRCTQAGIDAVDAGKTLGILSTTGFAIGVLGIGAGAYFVLSNSDESSASAPPKAQAFGVAVSGRW